MMKKNNKKIIPLIILLSIMLSLNVFASDVDLKSYPIETSSVTGRGTIGFKGFDPDLIPYFYNVEVQYDGKVDYNPNNGKDTVYSHHINSLGSTFNGNPNVTLVQLVAYQGGSEVGRTTSFNNCTRSHIWPGGKSIFFDKTSSKLFTVNHGTGKLQIVVLISEHDISFNMPMGSINVNF